MLSDYAGILAMFLMAIGVSGLFIYLSQTLGPRKPNAAKNMPYECGKPPFELPTGRHAVKFYLVSILFVIFDIELIFLFPWAVNLHELGFGVFGAVLFFLAVFELGFVYAWKKGALKWT
ncbi:MAG TPA: NADH-quinone oxidoreductase subunit A [Verrucomicrobiae bacterium]|jgi:NADH-quinone oxidoreductase subunit A|nr:NADH-quinone oxidoreductase subunit A [Verrucomicrobiae bacterium]